MPDKVKITEEDFEVFKKECLRWIDILGLKGYSFHFTHKKEEKQNYATIKTWTIPRVVTVNLATEVPKDLYSADEIKLAAFHEIYEVFLSRLVWLANSRCTSEWELDEETHKIVHTMEKVLYPKYRDEERSGEKHQKTATTDK